MRANLDRKAYQERFALTRGRARRLDKKRIRQLEKCSDHAARRLLLGVSSTCRPKGLKAGRTR